MTMTIKAQTPDEESMVNETRVVFLGDSISDNALLIYQWVVYAVVCQIIDVFGVVANIINIICFVEQGFKDLVNISLLGLAISDLGCLVPLIWTNICSIPMFRELDLPFEPMEVQYVTGAWPHVIFARVTIWITAFITLERCLCITMPLKIKLIFTQKRVTAIILCIYVVLITSVLSVFFVNRLEMKYSPTRNKTLFGLVFTADRDEVEAINFAVNSVFVQLSAFLALIICTVTLVVKLRSKTAWRQKSVAPGQQDASSTRDQKIAKMVIVIAALFIACFIPSCLIIIVMVVEPEFNIVGRYYKLFIMICSLGFVFESASSASNIFVYYHMSGKYRITLQRRFCCKKSEFGKQSI